MAKQDNETESQDEAKAPDAKGSKGQDGGGKATNGASAAQAEQKPAGAQASQANQTGAGAPNDAIALLKADHRKVEALFGQYEQATDDGKKDQLIRQICLELILHTRLEEDIFYPACRKAASDEDPLDEAQVEHDSAKLLIADLMNGSAEDPYRDAKVSVLAEQIKHHVGEEEEPSAGIFTKAQTAGVNTPELARKLQSRKQALQARADELSPSPVVSLQLGSLIRPQKEDYMARNNTPDRDERGRFTSDDDDRGGRGYGARGGGGGRSRYDDDDDRGYSSRGSRDDDDGRGWYGDPRGHSEAARRGWEERRGESRTFSRSRDDDDDDRRYSSRGSSERDRDDRGRFMSDDDDDRYSSRGRSASSGRDRDERGRFTDDDDRGGGRGRSMSRDDEGRFTSRGRNGDDDGRSRSRGRDDEDGRGWYGDPEGHAEAARRGWEERSGGGSRARGRDDDDDRRGGSRSRGRDDDDRGGRGRGQGGWFGDSRGHSEAARRGWEDRR